MSKVRGPDEKRPFLIGVIILIGFVLAALGKRVLGSPLLSSATVALPSSSSVIPAPMAADPPNGLQKAIEEIVLVWFKDLKFAPCHAF